MSLISTSYMVLVLVACLLYYLVPMAYRWIVLLIANAIFYFSASQSLSVFLLLSLVSIYIGAMVLQRQSDYQKEHLKVIEKSEKKAFKNLIKKRKKIILCVILAINVGLLLYLKYFNFFAGNINWIGSIFHLNFDIPAKEIILPLGISYYTLMAISYVVDVYRQKYKASNSLAKVALYLTFFPQMTEGPISRFDQLADQLYNGNKYEFRNIKCGLYLIIWGLFKKLVIADRAALFVNSVFGEQYGGMTVFLAVVLYTVQIYAEFSGAMDIVRGTGYMFGIYMEQNFAQPFFAKSIAEFWRRWHRTLGTWLKDYVFYSVSLSSMNMNLNRSVKKHLPGHFGRFILSAFPLFFVWFFNGFWHGASWKYISYGLYYYIIMMLGLLMQPLFNKVKEALHIKDENLVYQIFAILRTTLVVLGGMLLFRSHSVADAWSMLCSIFTFAPLDATVGGLVPFDYWIIISGLVMMLIVSILKEKKQDIYYLFSEKHLWIRYGVLLVILLMIIVFGIYGEGYDAGDFIYGAF